MQNEKLISYNVIKRAGILLHVFCIIVLKMELTTIEMGLSFICWISGLFQHLTQRTSGNDLISCTRKSRSMNFMDSRLAVPNGET